MQNVTTPTLDAEKLFWTFRKFVEPTDGSLCVHNMAVSSATWPTSFFDGEWLRILVQRGAHVVPLWNSAARNAAAAENRRLRHSEYCELKVCPTA